MSILDKFLSIMKLDDEDDFEDDLFGEDDDFEDTPRKNFFKKNKKTDYDDDEEYDDEYDEEYDDDEYDDDDIESEE